MTARRHSIDSDLGIVSDGCLLPPAASCLHRGVSPLLYREAVTFHSPASPRLAAHAGYACCVSWVGRADDRDPEPRSQSPKSAERCLERTVRGCAAALSGSLTAGLDHRLGLARHVLGDVYPGWRRAARLTPGYGVVRLWRTEPHYRGTRSSGVQRLGSGKLIAGKDHLGVSPLLYREAVSFHQNYDGSGHILLIEKARQRNRNRNHYHRILSCAFTSPARNPCPFLHTLHKWYGSFNPGRTIAGTDGRFRQRAASSREACRANDWPGTWGVRDCRSRICAWPTSDPVRH